MVKLVLNCFHAHTHTEKRSVQVTRTYEEHHEEETYHEELVEEGSYIADDDEAVEPEEDE